VTFASVDERLHAASWGDLASLAEARCAKARQEEQAIWLAGALPYDVKSKCTLALSKSRVEAEVPAALGIVVRAGSLNTASGTSRLKYIYGVESALQLIGVGWVDKVVLARPMTVELNAPVDVELLWRSLGAMSPSGFRFALDTSVSGGASSWLVGASPELLISKRGSVVEAHPLAGSLPRGEGGLSDAQVESELRSSAKDLLEHAYAVDSVRDVLAPICGKLHCPAQPEVVYTPTMVHLGTRITGVLLEPKTSVLRIAERLHPTAAVCGAPRQAARDAICRIEQFDRGLYAGAVGWVNQDGDGEWAVTLRCAVTQGARATLYAGAGIVAGSDPAKEWTETAGKLGTMLRALGLDERLSL